MQLRRECRPDGAVGVDHLPVADPGQGNVAGVVTGRLGPFHVALAHGGRDDGVAQTVDQDLGNTEGEKRGGRCHPVAVAGTETRRLRAVRRLRHRPMPVTGPPPERRRRPTRRRPGPGSSPTTPGFRPAGDGDRRPTMPGSHRRNDHRSPRDPCRSPRTTPRGRRRRPRPRRSVAIPHRPPGPPRAGTPRSRRPSPVRRPSGPTWSSESSCRRRARSRRGSGPPEGTAPVAGWPEPRDLRPGCGACHRRPGCGARRTTLAKGHLASRRLCAAYGRGALSVGQTGGTRVTLNSAGY